MKLLMISGLTAIAVLAAATNMPRSHPSSSVAGMPAMQEMHKAQQGKLPVDDFEDRSLVYPRGVQP
ncbi:hypothetical protein AYJ54_40770 [Bradyrhizobium centrolobii]|uniref:Uncharacterized protein n=1 Tax=Bradyrhizobium centrolobii TaxID=1505087 RepID=A0A176Z591_9BRAD|nr:hypothetical protein [Bradyrhizobium centrolobii]OAF14912.1 hypothetical protein AYJ54_40770 [Bradyrhizobium centrolobii]